MKVFWRLTVGCAAAALSACGGQPEDPENPVLAEVGDKRITASELLDFERRLPKELRTDKTGADGYLDYLQTLIDKEIYLQEAVKRGLDRDAGLVAKLRREKEDRMLNLLFKGAFADKVEVGEEEMRARYDAVEKKREMKLRIIVVESEAEGRDILQRLGRGEEFSALAAERSLHTSTASKGGELDEYLTLKRIPIYLHKHIQALAVGELSEPIRLPNGQYGIYQITDARAIPFSKSRSDIEAVLAEEKTGELVAAYLQRLRTEIGLSSDAEALRRLQDRVGTGEGGQEAQARDEVLFEFEGGRISVGDFWDYAEAIDMGFSGDVDEAVRWFAEDVLLPRALFLKAAYDQGLDRDPKIERWHARRLDSMLLQALRQDGVKDRVEVDSAAVRRFYDSRPDLFTPPEEVVLREIMVRTREEAAALKARVEAGEDMAALADEHTLRTVGKGVGGRFHIHTFEQAFYKELIDATRRAEVGALYGPLAVRAAPALVSDPNTVQPGGEYFSIFRVLESNFGQSPAPFEKEAKRARALLRRAEESRLGSQLLQQLRGDYDARVVVHEDRLESLAP